MKKSAYVLSVLVLISCNQPARAVTQDEMVENVVKASVVVVGAGLVVGGIYKLVSWLNREISHQNLLARAQNVYLETHKDAFQAYNCISEFYIAHQWVNEASLARIAGRREIMAMQQSLTWWKSSVEKEYKDLVSRINRLDNLRLSSEDRMVFDNMRKCKKQLAELIKVLDVLYDFNKEHGGYFDLYNHVNYMMKKYAQVLVNPADYIVLKQAILRFKIDTKCEYPFAEYYENIRTDIKKLDAYVHNADQKYPALAEITRALTAQFDTMINVVIMSSDYEAELRRREQDYYERQRIYALQEQANAEKEKAAAMRAQARAQDQQARAMREQARAMREQARVPVVVVQQNNIPQNNTRYHNSPPPYNPEAVAADGTWL